MSTWEIEYKPARGKGFWHSFQVEAATRADAISVAAWLASQQCPGYVLARAIERSERPQEQQAAQ